MVHISVIIIPMLGCGREGSRAWITCSWFARSFLVPGEDILWSYFAHQRLPCIMVYRERSEKKQGKGKEAS